jgi:hypothetical protein
VIYGQEESDDSAKEATFSEIAAMLVVLTIGSKESSIASDLFFVPRTTYHYGSRQ